jgi:hypothetical protein
MEKTITIDGKEVRFKATASFPLLYKANFNVDVLTIIMPLLSEVIGGASGMVTKETFKNGSLLLTPETISMALEGVYSLELIDVMNLLWTMAKCADDEIPDPVKWFGQFEEFPVVDIAIQVFPMLFSSLLSKKKLKGTTTPPKKTPQKSTLN